MDKTKRERLVREKKQCAIDALRAARQLLSRHGAWCQGSLAMTLVNGEWLDCVATDILHAHEVSAQEGKFCMIGSLEHVLGVDFGSDPPAGTHPALDELASQLFNATGRCSIADWNDDINRKKSQVLAMFDRTIARLEKELAK